MSTSATMSGKVRYALATSVSKPENQGTGRAVVTDYLITTSFDGAEALVRRTFEDFEWVQGRLVEERMGIIVPVLPTKRPASKKEKMSEEFISDRQEGLDRFLQRVIHHPDLVDSPSLLLFFTAGPVDWNAAKDKSHGDGATLAVDRSADQDSDPNTIEIDAPGAMHSPVERKSKGTLGGWFAAKRDQWALQKKNLNLEETPAEAKKFSDLHSYADHLETCVRILSEDHKEILTASDTLAEKCQTMGAAFTQLWGEHELSTTSSSTLYQSIGQLWNTLSKLGKDNVSSGKRHFESPVEDLIMDVLALKAALAKRKAAVFLYTKKTQEGRSLNDQMEKLRETNDFVGQQDKYYKLEKELRECDMIIDKSKKQCKLVTSRLSRDVERFRIEWHERMRQVLEIYHQKQLEYLQTQAQEFSSALPTLSALESRRADLPTGLKTIAKTDIKVQVTTSGAKASVATIESDESDQDESYPVESATLPPPPPIPPPPVPFDSPISPGGAPKVESSGSIGFDTSDDGFQAMGGQAKTDGRPNGGPIMKSL